MGILNREAANEHQIDDFVGGDYTIEGFSVDLALSKFSQWNHL